MANVSRPAGLTPVEYLNGSPWNGQARRYCILSTDTNAYAIGDPVVLSGTADANGIATVTLATAGTGNPVTGAIVSMGGPDYGGPSADPTNLNTTIIPATKTRNYYVLVADDPSIVFEVEENNAGAPLTAAAVGSNVNLASGANNGYVSGWKIASNSSGTGATLQCQLLGLAQRADNAIGASAKWLVRINNHSYRAGVAGV